MNVHIFLGITWDTLINVYTASNRQPLFKTGFTCTAETPNSIGAGSVYPIDRLLHQMNSHVLIGHDK